MDPWGTLDEGKNGDKIQPLKKTGFTLPSKQDENIYFS